MVGQSEELHREKGLSGEEVYGRATRSRISSNIDPTGTKMKRKKKPFMFKCHNSTEMVSPRVKEGRGRYDHEDVQQAGKEKKGEGQ